MSNAKRGFQDLRSPPDSDELEPPASVGRPQARSLDEEGVDGSSPSEGSPRRASIRRLCRSGDQRGAGPNVHGTSTGVHTAAAAAVVVEQLDGVVVAVAGEVAVGAVDVDDAGAHVARELVGAEASAQRDGGERVPQIVEATGRGDAGGTLRGTPVARPPVVQVEVATLGGGEEKRRRA